MTEPLSKRPAASDRPVQSVQNLDVGRYMGLWYEIFRLPLKWEEEGARDITAHYTLRPDGKIVVDNRCLLPDGRPKQALGLAKPVGGSTSRLKVSFLPKAIRWLPLGWGDYWVLKIDPDYLYSLVGDPARKYLWLLSRSPQVPQGVADHYLNYALSLGYDLGPLIVPDQSGNRVTEEMLRS